MLRAPRVARGPASRYLAWRLIQESQRNENNDQREVTNRAVLRAKFNYNALSENEFQRRYRLSTNTFRFLCEELKEITPLRASTRMTLEHKVLCALNFYATGSYQRSVGMGKYLGQSTVSKIVTEVTNALTCPGMLNRHIHFPKTAHERNLIKQKFYTKYGIPGVIGCVDGSHFHIFQPKKAVEHLFFCRKNFHSLNVQVVCDSDCRIININPKYGGATHDCFVWNNSQVSTFMETLYRNGEQGWLLGDSGYPQRPWLMTPINDAADDSPEAKYNHLHGKARVLIENTFGRLKNRWRCLNKDRTLHYAPEKCAKIITACAVLHNIAIDFMVPLLEQDDTDALIVETVPQEEVPNSSLRESSAEDLVRGRASRRTLVDRLNRLQR
ncbi:unnamed protein product [Plutella xylostella]|uniref:(diamondback moth) hypothetical protein n=1 Tax=Plutella xylostella TaxID=51655 RepID=A0A8S4G2S1_PLUXY|nr:putative nuclease HARBI1 [Plutella xylostella]CAG9135385.1 unnamed protein product [Plutella xylostella]